MLVYSSSGSYKLGDMVCHLWSVWKTVSHNLGSGRVRVIA